VNRILALAAVAAVSCASAAVAQPDAQMMLDAHNADRARHCAPPLAWSAEVAATAQRWADRCVFTHDRDNRLGENLAWGTRLSARDAVGLWYNEAGNYNFRAPGFSAATGHFTQLIWRDSRLLGCGRASCQGQSFYVCRYGPPGNVEGRYQANVAPACR